MLDPKWEKLADELINTPDLKQFLKDLNSRKIEGFEFDFDLFSNVEDPPLWGMVFTGMDTRSSSRRLENEVNNAIVTFSEKF